jgi:sRNA-binding protein
MRACIVPLSVVAANGNRLDLSGYLQDGEAMHTMRHVRKAERWVRRAQAELRRQRRIHEAHQAHLKAVGADKCVQLIA